MALQKEDQHQHQLQRRKGYALSSLCFSEKLVWCVVGIPRYALLAIEAGEFGMVVSTTFDVSSNGDR